MAGLQEATRKVDLASKLTDRGFSGVSAFVGGVSIVGDGFALYDAFRSGSDSSAAGKTSVGLGTGADVLGTANAIASVAGKDLSLTDKTLVLGKLAPGFEKVAPAIEKWAPGLEKVAPGIGKMMPGVGTVASIAGAASDVASAVDDFKQGKKLDGAMDVVSAVGNCISAAGTLTPPPADLALGLVGSGVSLGASLVKHLF
jgi:hypothetical protein